LFRKIKMISALTPNELINITRLKKAAQLLAETDLKVYEISFMVGFNSQTSFGRSFFRQFGMTPTQYQKSRHI
ncbi:MAG TPA: AraC family transcriptional regulator, partial [Flavobacterium sp.]|nr:AraC family transcriptional regulator [Flavobacterium sp.]